MALFPAIAPPRSAPARVIAPLHRMASRQRPGKGRGEPDAQQHALRARRRVVGKAGAAVIGDVLVHELDVADLERHLQADLLADLVDHVHRLDLRRGEARDGRHFLRLADIGARILAGEAAVGAAREHRHREGAVVALGVAFLVERPHPPIILVEHAQQIGALRAISLWSVTLDTTFDNPPAMPLLAQSRR